MLRQRIVSGVLLGSGVFAIAFGAPPWVVLLFVLAFVVIGQSEVYGLLRCGGFPVYNRLGVLLGVLMVIGTYLTAGNPAVALKTETTIGVLAVLAVFVRSLWDRAEDKPVEAVAGTILGLIYIPFLFLFMMRLAFSWGPSCSVTRVGTEGVRLCLYLLIVVKFSDIGAYFTGMNFGKHKMFPRVSPKKSWEGAVGGLLTSLAASLIFWWIVDCGNFGGMVTMRWWDAVILGVLLPVVGMVGDLCESQIKRACNAKDSGSIVPGMGGILDVIDSLLFGVPVLYCYVVWFLVV